MKHHDELKKIRIINVTLVNFIAALAIVGLILLFNSIQSGLLSPIVFNGANGSTLRLQISDQKPAGSSHEFLDNNLISIDEPIYDPTETLLLNRNANGDIENFFRIQAKFEYHR